MPSAQRLIPVSNPDLWKYNPEELVRFAPLRRFSSTVVHQRSRPMQIKRDVHCAKNLVYASVYFCVYFAYTINIPRVVYISNIHLVYFKNP